MTAVPAVAVAVKSPSPSGPSPPPDLGSPDLGPPDRAEPPPEPLQPPTELDGGTRRLLRSVHKCSCASSARRTGSCALQGSMSTPVGSSRTGRRRTSQERAERAAGLLAEVGTDSLRASALAVEDMVVGAEGDLDTARPRIEDAIELFQQSGAPLERTTLTSSPSLWGPSTTRLGRDAGVPGGRLRVLLAGRSRSVAKRPHRIYCRDGLDRGPSAFRTSGRRPRSRERSCCTTCSRNAASGTTWTFR